jgi:predicted transcriptional regulator
MFNIIEHGMSLKELQSLITAPEMNAEAIMKCALGVRVTEMEAYCALVSGGPSSVQQVAEKIGKSRPTAQRLLQNIVDKRLAIREERLIGLGGYQYVYSALSPEMMKEVVMETLEEWYQRMMKEIDNLPSRLDEMGKRCIRFTDTR